MPCNKMKLSSGDLSERVEFHAVTAAPDGAGGQTETWAAVASAMAKITPKTGREDFTSGRMESYTFYEVICRYNAAITPATRMVWASKNFEIKSVLNVEVGNRFMKLKVVEGEL
jgi:SPP1 family predicted phage head-tail adaptor